MGISTRDPQFLVQNISGLLEIEEYEGTRDDVFFKFVPHLYNP
jgi:hypothetical protein